MYGAGYVCYEWSSGVNHYELVLAVSRKCCYGCRTVAAENNASVIVCGVVAVWCDAESVGVWRRRESSR